MYTISFSVYYFVRSMCEKIYIYITGDALDWFRPYLTGRIQCVVIEEYVSVDMEFGFGVPQGSVLGTQIYCMCTKPVNDITQPNITFHHSYTDHTPLYMTIDYSNNNWRDGLARIYTDLSIRIGDTVVDCSSYVKYIGDIFYRVLSLRQHVSYTSKMC